MYTINTKFRQSGHTMASEMKLKAPEKGVYVQIDFIVCAI